MRDHSMTAPELESGPPAVGSTVRRPTERLPTHVRLATLAVILGPLLGVLVTPFLVWGWGFGWSDAVVFLVMYAATTVGITVGFHRMFVHRSFEAYTWVKVVFAALGSMAIQGSLLRWVALHRQHHQHSDTADDPHTPHHHGRGIRGMLKGFWHSHMGWFFHYDTSDLSKYVKDLRASKAIVAASKLFPLWAVLGFVIPAVLGGLLTMSWAGALTGAIWGGPVRLFLVHHITWSINSACHLWGSKPYKSDDESRDNAVFGILAMGEGWHNAHHAFPTSARHGLKWWKIDMSYYLIRAMQFAGVAWAVKVPTKAQLAKASA